MSTQGALGAIGGAIDRATIALLWLGRGVFTVATIAAVAYVASGAHQWWTMPDLAKVDRNIQRLIAQGAPNEHLQLYIDHEGVTIEQVAAHKQGRGVRVPEQFRDALGFILVGAIFLGLTRVTRWIVTGR